MNMITRFTAAAAITLAVGAGLSACGSDSDVDVLEYGYYTPTHVWVVYPTPHVVHVSYTVYHSDSRRYSTPAQEKSYVKDPHHTVVHTEKTTITKTTKKR